ALLIDPRELLDGEGKPIPSRKLLQKYGRGRFLARAATNPEIRPTRLRNAVAHRVRSKKCAVVLRQSVRFIAGRVTFDPNCDSLEEEVRKDRNARKTPPPGFSQRPSRKRAKQNRGRRAVYVPDEFSDNESREGETHE